MYNIYFFVNLDKDNYKRADIFSIIFWYYQ